MTLIDTIEIQSALKDIFVANDNIRKYTNRIKEGSYEMKSINGIELYVNVGIPEITDRALVNASEYKIPMSLDMVCRYRTKDKLDIQLINLVNYVRDSIEDNYRLGGLVNGYTTPFEISADIIPEENPEVYVYTIIIEYTLIKIRGE